jgi:DNA-binding HxlR family transcriptional regulator
MTSVPATVRPNLPAAVERGIDAFGNRVRVAVLQSLRTDGPATRTELAARLRVSRSLLQTHLRRLESLGTIQAQPPGTHPDHRTRVYTVNTAAVDSLLDALTSTLHGH